MVVSIDTPASLSGDQQPDENNETMTERVSVLVTGASGGIGYATAMALAQRGARVCAHFKTNREGANKLLADMSGSGHITCQCDVTNPDDIQKMIATVAAEMGGLDVLVNNAGIADVQEIDKIDYKAWQQSWNRVMEANLTGPANLSYCAMKTMLESGGGRIVNVSSRGAFRGEPSMPWYGAAKAGMNAMGQSMAQALAPKNIFIYTIAPGFVETEMAQEILASEKGDEIRNQSSMGRVAQPEEVAQTIAFLALDAPDFMTGCIVDINGASYLRS